MEQLERETPKLRSLDEIDFSSFYGKGNEAFLNAGLVNKVKALMKYVAHQELLLLQEQQEGTFNQEHHYLQGKIDYIKHKYNLP